MATKAFIENLPALFKCPKYSDIKIRIGTLDIKAHKLVLAQGSDYFKGAFDSGFKEASEGMIELHEDDPNAIFAMVAFCYGLIYDGSGGYTDNRRFPANREGALKFVKHQVDVYVVAHKYLMASLCTEIMTCFGVLVAYSTKHAGTGNEFTPVEEVAKYVYVNHKEAAEGLRKPLVHFLVEQLKFLKKPELCQELVLEVPELGYDLVAALTKDVAGATAPVTRKRTRLAEKAEKLGTGEFLLA